MHQTSWRIALLALSVMAAMELAPLGGARGAATTVGRAATWLSSNAGTDEIARRAEGEGVVGDLSHHRPENSVARSWH